MVLSPDSRQAAHPEQEAVVPAGSACEEGGAGGRKEWPQRLGLSWAIVQPGHCGAALSQHTLAITACRSKVLELRSG